MRDYVFIVLAVVIIGLVFLVMKPGSKQEQETVRSTTSTTKAEPTSPTIDIDQALKELGYINMPKFLEDAKKLVSESLGSVGAHVELASSSFPLHRLPRDLSMAVGVRVAFKRIDRSLGALLGDYTVTKAVVSYSLSVQGNVPVHIVVVKPYPWERSLCLKAGDYEVTVSQDNPFETSFWTKWEGALLPAARYTLTLVLATPKSLLPQQWEEERLMPELRQQEGQSEEICYLTTSIDEQLLARLTDKIKEALYEASKSPAVTRESLMMMLAPVVEQIVQDTSQRSQELESRQQRIIYDLSIQIAEMILSYVWAIQKPWKP